MEGSENSCSNTARLPALLRGLFVSANPKSSVLYTVQAKPTPKPTPTPKDKPSALRKASVCEAAKCKLPGLPSLPLQRSGGQVGREDARLQLFLAARHG